MRVLEPGGNLGFAAANNIGIRATAGELVLLLNPDTVVDRPAPSTGWSPPSPRNRRRRSPGRGSSTATGARSCRSGR